MRSSKRVWPLAVLAAAWAGVTVLWVVSNEPTYLIMLAAVTAGAHGAVFGFEAWHR